MSETLETTEGETSEEGYGSGGVMDGDGPRDGGQPAADLEDAA